MSGAIMNKVWDLFGMDNAEDSKVLDTANKVKPTDNAGEQEVKTEEG